MYRKILIRVLTFFLLAITTLALPSPAPTPPAKRQISPELLALASAVGITSVPNDPAKISSISLIIGGITEQLPPSPVLSVLETAIPPSLISELGSNPESLSAFASQFSAGSTPGWYKSLPASVRSFFNTYSADFGELRSAESSITSVIGSQMSGSESGSGPTQTASVSVTTATETATETATITTTAGAPQGSSQSGAAATVPAGIKSSLVGAVGALILVLGL